MKKWGLCILLLLILTGCNSSTAKEGHVTKNNHIIIDWVDFVKWDGKQYYVIHSGVLADKRYLGEKIGMVKFKVADNVSNPEYKIKNGDAAFHEKGTEIFRINGSSNFIAVKSPRSVNGYKVYFSKEDTDYKWNYKDMPTEKVKRIEIYQAYTQEGNKLIAQLTKKQDVKSFIQLLENSETKPHFQPNTENGDPIYYEMIFYVDDAIAYKFGLQFDGETYFWHPWDISILPDEIKKYISEN